MANLRVRLLAAATQPASTRRRWSLARTKPSRNPRLPSPPSLPTTAGFGLQIDESSGSVIWPNRGEDQGDDRGL